MNKPPEPKAGIKPAISDIDSNMAARFRTALVRKTASHEPPRSIPLFEAMGKRPQPSEVTERCNVMVRDFVTMSGAKRLRRARGMHGEYGRKCCDNVEKWG